MKPQFRLYWIEPDPDRERAADPLGLNAQADRIADRLLPNLSVLTRRARYLSFFCWAVRKTASQRNQLESIHRLEAELALEEARKHAKQGSSLCPDIVGRQRAYDYLQANAGRLPVRPERLYKNMAFSAYRALMRTLGLLEPDRRLTLSDEGERLATLFQMARGPKPRCLTEISAGEASRIKALLGLDFRTQVISTAAERRRKTFAEIRPHLERNLSAAEILQFYDSRPRLSKTTKHDLHCAFAWENLSLGLTLAFAILLTENSVAAASRRFREGLRQRAYWPGLRTFDPRDDAAPAHIR